MGQQDIDPPRGEVIDWDKASELRDDVGLEAFREVVDLFLIEVGAEDRTALAGWMALWAAAGEGEVQASGDVVRTRVEPPLAGDGGR